MPDEELGGILTLVSRIEDANYYTIKQVARQVGRDASTIKRWIRKNKKLRATHYMDIGAGGKNFIWLYTEQDISRIKAYGATLKPGRPKKK